MFKLLFTMLISTSFVFATDFTQSHCYKYLSSKVELAHFNEFWVIQPDGTMKLDKETQIQLFPRANILIEKDKPNQVVIINNSLYGGSTKSIIHFDDKKRIIKIDTTRKVHNLTINSNINLNYKNDICYPQNEETDRSAGRLHGLTKYAFHTDLCKDLQNYLEKNPDALKCHCGTPATRKSLESIFEAHGERKSSIFNWNDFFQTQKTSIDNGSKQYLVANDTHKDSSGVLYQALLTIEDCIRKPGVWDALMDEKLWEVKPADPINQSSGASTKPQ